MFAKDRDGLKPPCEVELKLQYLAKALIWGFKLWFCRGLQPPTSPLIWTTN